MAVAPQAMAYTIPVGVTAAFFVFRVVKERAIGHKKTLIGNANQGFPVGWEADGLPAQMLGSYQLISSKRGKSP